VSSIVGLARACVCDTWPQQTQFSRPRHCHLPVPWGQNRTASPGSSIVPKHRHPAAVRPPFVCPASASPFSSEPPGRPSDRKTSAVRCRPDVYTCIHLQHTLNTIEKRLKQCRYTVLQRWSFRRKRFVLRYRTQKRDGPAISRYRYIREVRYHWDGAAYCVEFTVYCSIHAIRLMSDDFPFWLMYNNNMPLLDEMNGKQSIFENERDLKYWLLYDYIIVGPSISVLSLF